MQCMRLVEKYEIGLMAPYLRTRQQQFWPNRLEMGADEQNEHHATEAAPRPLTHYFSFAFKCKRIFLPWR